MADPINIDKLPGMKHRDFKPCVSCGRGMMHAGSVTFFRLKIERFVIDTREVQRAHGMEMMMGNAVLANIMGPNADLAKQLHEFNVLVCEPCAIGLEPDKVEQAALWSLYDKASRAASEKEDAA